MPWSHLFCLYIFLEVIYQCKPPFLTMHFCILCGSQGLLLLVYYFCSQEKNTFGIKSVKKDRKQASQKVCDHMCFVSTFGIFFITQTQSSLIRICHIVITVGISQNLIFEICIIFQEIFRLIFWKKNVKILWKTRQPMEKHKNCCHLKMRYDKITNSFVISSPNTTANTHKTHWLNHFGLLGNHTWLVCWKSALSFTTKEKQQYFGKQKAVDQKPLLWPTPPLCCERFTQYQPQLS